MTTETMPADTPVAPPPARSSGAPSGYGQLWRSVPRELGFLLVGYPIAVAGFAATVTLFSGGVGTLVIVVGIFAIAAALYVGRGFGTVQLLLLEWAGRPHIERPEWQDGRARQGFWGWARALFINGHYWLYLLFSLVVNFAVTMFSWIITVVWVSVIASGLTYWAWPRLGLRDSSSWHFSTWLLTGNGIAEGDGANVAIDIAFYFVCSVILAALLPYVSRGLVLLHYTVARGMLGAFRSDALQREVIALNASRGAAQAAEGHSLRRLERDIHDGPQQRLVRLQMDLAAADRQLDSDPAKARVLLAEAMQQSKDALEELRALSRGFAPPILMDRGLVAAFQSAAVRSSIPTRVVSDLAPDTVLPQEIERNAYFVGSEALANAAKHSGATDIEVRVGVRRLPESDETWLDVVITDNGSGGARLVAGHGLANLDERMRGLGGTVDVDSPVGGPTVISAHLPVTVALPPSV